MTINQAQIVRAVPTVDRKNAYSFVAYFNMYAIHFGITKKPSDENPVEEEQ